MIHLGADRESENFLVLSQWASKEAHDRNEDNPTDVESQRAATPYLVAPRSYREVRNPRLEALARHLLTYGSLVGLLLALFVGGVVALQWLVRAVTGQSSDLVLVAATLLVAVLFQPLRRRIHREIEQRFYRERYRTAQTSEEFQRAIQNEVDLSHVSERIITRVHDTVHPAFASLWILPVFHHVEDRSLLPSVNEQLHVFGSEIVDPLTAEPTVMI
jgi:hypothetical protein